MPTDKQNRHKLHLLCEQARKHAKASGLQVFVMYESEEKGQVSVSPHYGVAMLQSVISYLVSRHPQIVADTIDKLNDMASDVFSGIDGPSDVLHPPVEVLDGVDEIQPPLDGDKAELALGGHGES